MSKDDYRAGNPWVRLGSIPFVLPEDADAIERFNIRAKNTAYEIDLTVRPEPFVGSPEAPIWLLNLNPGLAESDHHHTPDVLQMQKQNVELRADKFWYLEDKYSATAGHKWWRKCTGPLTKEFGLEKVARSLFCVELFPYHSRKFKDIGTILPSQQYTIDLVSRGCRAGKKFIVMRQKENWTNFVPGLKSCELMELKNVRTTWISPGNVSEPGRLRSWFE